MVSIWSLRSLRKWMKVEGTCLWHIVRAICQIQHDGCEGWIFILMGAFQRKRLPERQGTHKFCVREIFQKRKFRYFAVGNAVHPGIVAVATIAVIATIAGEWFPYDRCDRYDRWDRTEVYLSDRCRCDRYDHCVRWRVVSIWSLRELNFFSAIVAIAAIVAIIWKTAFNAVGIVNHGRTFRLW